MLESFIGRRYGQLVITFVEKVKRQCVVHYICDCGKEGTTRFHLLRRGKVHCGAWNPHRAKPHVEQPHPICSGMRFERRLVLYRLRDLGTPTWFLCRRDCNTVHAVRANSLMQGVSRSCGCLTREVSGQRLRRLNLEHGLSKTPEYRAYYKAKERCNNPKHPKYPRYGGRGIRFLFTSFEQFFAEIGPRPTAQHSLDRKDNDGNYEHGNLRWATPKSSQIISKRWARSH